MVSETTRLGLDHKRGGRSVDRSVGGGNAEGRFSTRVGASGVRGGPDTGGGRDGKYARRLMIVMREAINEAGRMGVSFDLLADRLGVARSTFASWWHPGRRNMPPAYRVIEMVSREDVLPAEPLARLRLKLGEEMGVFDMEPFESADGSEDGRIPTVARLLRVHAMSGAMSEEYLAATAAGSDGGETLTEAEAELVLECALETRAMLDSVIERVRGLVAGDSRPSRVGQAKGVTR